MRATALLALAADPVKVPVEAVRVGCGDREVDRANVGTVEVPNLSGRRDAKCRVGRLTGCLCASDKNAAGKGCHSQQETKSKAASENGHDGLRVDSETTSNIG